MLAMAGTVVMLAMAGRVVMLTTSLHVVGGGQLERQERWGPVAARLVDPNSSWVAGFD